MMLLTRSRNLRLFSTSIVDQFLLSFGNFLMGFLLIRHATDVDYGLFVLVQSGITLLVAAQAAWLMGPLTVLIPHKPSADGLEMIGSIERSQRRRVSWVTTLALSVPLICYLTKIWTGVEALAAAIGLLAGLTAVIREFSRNVLLIFSQPQAVLQADVIYVAIVICGAIVAAYGPGRAVVSSLAALVLAGAAGGFAAHFFVGKSPGWRGKSAAAGPFRAELRTLGIWSAVGSVIYWIYSQSYNYVLASRLDLTAVADVNAARLLLMPAFILTVGINSLLTPLAANWLARDGISSMMRRVWLVIPGVLLMNFIYVAIVWFSQDMLTTQFMHKVIHDRELLIIMWSAIVLITLTREILQSAAFVFGQLRSLAWLTAASAAVTLPVMWFGLSYWGAVAALIGQVCGELVSLTGMLILLPKMAARYRSLNKASGT